MDAEVRGTQALVLYLSVAREVVWDSHNGGSCTMRNVIGLYTDMH